MSNFFLNFAGIFWKLTNKNQKFSGASQSRVKIDGFLCSSLNSITEGITRFLKNKEEIRISLKGG